MKTAIAACIIGVVARSALAGARWGAGLEARVGSIRAPFASAAQPSVKSELLQASSLVIDGWVRVHPQWIVGTRVPFATSAIAEPAGSYVADNTLGNVLVVGAYERSLRPSTMARAHAALGVPLAGSGETPSLVRNRVVAASDALDGWRSIELYQPGMLPLVVGTELVETRSSWRARAGVKLVTSIRTSDAGLDAPPSFGFVPSVEADAGWRARPWLTLGLGAHAVILAIPPAAPMRDVGRSGRVHLGIAPKLAIERGRASISLDVLVAIAGPLVDTIGLGASVAWHH